MTTRWEEVTSRIPPEINNPLIDTSITVILRTNFSNYFVFIKNWNKFRNFMDSSMYVTFVNEELIESSDQLFI